MNAKEFFYLVAEMRDAQNAYFETRDNRVLRACRALENNVDKEIRRVREIVNGRADAEVCERNHQLKNNPAE